MHRGLPDVVTSDLVARDRADLLAEIRLDRHRTAWLGAMIGLLIAMLRVSKVPLDYERLPDGDAKRILLRAIERAGKVLPLNAALRIARLSSSRTHSGCRAEDGCERDDPPSGPRLVPTRLTPSEREAMQERVESDDNTHTGRCEDWHFTHSESRRSSYLPRRGIGCSERRAGDGLERGSIPPSPR